MAVARLTWPAAVLFVGVALCSGQSSRIQTEASTSPETGTIRGCLSGSNGSYTLTQDGTGAMFALAGSENKLKNYLNDEVAVTGEITSSNSSSASQDEGDTAAGGGAHPAISSTLQVTDVKIESKHCSSGSSSQPTH